MSVDQIGKNKLALPGKIPGHQDLETLARSDGRYSINALFNAWMDGHEVARAPIAWPDGDHHEAVAKLREALWGFHPADRRKELSTVIQRSLGFAAVLSAELQGIKWQEDGVPAIELPSLPSNLYARRSHLYIEAGEYFTPRGTLDYTANFFVGSLITDNAIWRPGSLALIALGLKSSDHALQERYIDAQMAPLSSQLEAFGVLPYDPNDSPA